jgi:hypothetical protein
MKTKIPLLWLGALLGVVPILSADTAILSGNTFSSSDDLANYGTFEKYSNPRSGVSYTFQDPVNTGGLENTNDPDRTKLTSGLIKSTDATHLVNIGNTSGVTKISVVFDLGNVCNVSRVDLWARCGIGTQIKKVLITTSLDGISYTSFGNTTATLPVSDSVLNIQTEPVAAKSARYVKMIVEENVLDYNGGYSYRLSLGEIVIMGTAPNDSSGSLLSNNYLRSTGTYHTSTPKIATQATYQWLTTQPFASESALLTTDNDLTNDGAGGLPDLIDGTDLQTNGDAVCSTAMGSQGKYGAVVFNLNDVYAISKIDVWTKSESGKYMDGYEVLFSTDGVNYTSWGFTANQHSRTANAMVNAETSGITGRNARYVKLILHNALNSQQMIVGEIAIWGAPLYDVTLPKKPTPDKVVINTTLKNYSSLFIDWSDYNKVVNNAGKFRLYIEKTDFSNVTGLIPKATYQSSTVQALGKCANYFALEPQTTYYVAVTPFTPLDVERKDVTTIQVTTPSVIGTSAKIGDIFNINDPPYGAGSSYVAHADELANLGTKLSLLREIGSINKSRWFNHDQAPIKQYGAAGLAFHLFYHGTTYLTGDNSRGSWSFSSYNEPDLAGRSGAEVAAGIQANHAQIKAHDSRNLLVEPALASTNADGLLWLHGLYNADGQNGQLVKTYFDVMDVHAYCKYADPAPAGLLPGVPEALIQKISALRSLMAGYGDGDKPIVFTELGWSTYAGGAYMRAINRTTQRDYLVRAYLHSIANDIKAVYWYNFQDNGITGGIEDNFGIIDWYGIPKPAYYGYYIMSRVLKDTEYQGVAANVSNPYYGYRFWDANRSSHVTSLWAANETTKTATLTTSATGITVVGVDGSYQYLPVSGGVVNVTISAAPVFIYSKSGVSVSSIN